jgi:hypothetical protein
MIKNEDMYRFRQDQEHQHKGDDIDEQVLDERSTLITSRNSAHRTAIIDFDVSIGGTPCLDPYRITKKKSAFALLKDHA